ncbi:7-cyano-7-deazaguanine synthase [bacterium]|nr:7-cyano-7-deazaguanine synthase [bacterium]
MATDEPFLAWCGPESVPRDLAHGFNKVECLATSGPNKNVNLHFENIHRRLAQDIPDVAADLLEIASYVYCADQAFTRGGPTLPRNGKNWNRRIRLCIPVRNHDLWNRDDVLQCLEETLGFLSDDHYRFEFRTGGSPANPMSYFDFNHDEAWFHADSVLLFSGGLDSLTGAVDELVDQGGSVALVSHRPVGKIANRQVNLVDAVRGLTGSSDRILHVPVWMNKGAELSRDANQRSRSFLYAALGASVAKMLGVNEIKFYENGIVSVNLPLSEQVVGGRASRSTHPKVLRGFEQIISLVFGQDFSVSNPYLSKTKSEVVGKLADLGAKELIPLTNSCSHTRQTTKLHTHCGVCSQCIERRVATTYCKVEDCDPEEQYAVSLFTDPIPNAMDRTMVLSYFQHARKLLRMGDDEFIQGFGEITRLLAHVKLPTSKAARMFLDLHKRHGAQVCDSLARVIRRHSQEIAEGRLNSDSLLAAIGVKPGSNASGTSTSQRFPTPEGTRWSDITIEVTSDNAIRVRVGDITRSYAALDVGFRDGRTAETLSKQWKLLLVFAYCDGALSWTSPYAKPDKAKPVQELAKVLKSFFGLSESPFHRYSKEFGWVAKFKLTDCRGSSSRH